MNIDYVAKVNESRVYEAAKVTALERMRRFSAKLGAEVFLKREDTQSIHSFKIRGAYNKMCRLPKELLAQGVLAASAGNHAQGVALSAQLLGTKATIVMPETTPQLKIDEVKDLGAEIVLKGETYSDAAAEARRLVAEKGFTFIPPYDDPDVIAGQGTVAKEILEQCPQVDAIFVPIGGGGFAAGVSAYVKGVKPSVKVYGVEPEDSDCMRRSIDAGECVTVEHPGLFADGVCVKTPGVETFRICRDCLDGIVLVTMSEICRSIGDIFEATRSVCEPAGALGFAALKKTLRRGETGVAIVSGANMNFDSLCFIAADASAVRFRDRIMADGKIDFSETTELLRALKAYVTPDPKIEELIRVLEDARFNGEISARESATILESLENLLDRQMITAAEREALM